jgi:hypothetical protein
MVIKKTLLLDIILVFSFFEKIKYPLFILSSLCWFFHETRQFFEVFEILKLDHSLNFIFLNTQTQWLFHLKFFKYLKL